MAYMSAYQSKSGYLLGEVAPTLVFGAALSYLLYRSYKDMSDLNDLNREVTFHRHQQTTGQHTDVAVNSNLEPLYLSGAWF